MSKPRLVATLQPASPAPPARETSWVFVTHSRADTEGQAFLFHLFNQPTSRFRPYFYSADRPSPPHAEPIRTKIREANALFVLLSEPMVKNPYTKAWVGYEVGIASERNLPVVVVDPESSPVDLPVPGSTVYLQRPDKATGGWSELWKVVAETACHLVPSNPEKFPGTFWGDFLALMYNMAVSDQDSTGQFHRIACGYEHCRSRFYVPETLYQLKPVPCPSCRKPTASTRVQLTEFALKGIEEKKRAAKG